MVVPTKTFSGRLVEIAATCAAGSLSWNCSQPQPVPAPRATPVLVQVPSARAHAPPPEPAPPAPPAGGKLCPDADWQPLVGLLPSESHDHVAIMERLGGQGAAKMRWASG